MQRRGVLLFGIILLVLIVGGGMWWLRSPHSSQFGQPSTAPVAVHYLCDGGKIIDATYTNNTPAPTSAPGQPPQPTGSASIILSDGRSMTLPQTMSASGIRYANANESFIFWSKGNGAFTMENNKETFQDCIAVVPNPGNLPEAYANPHMGFSIRYPQLYKVNASYTYQELGPGKDIGGVKFTIPTSLASGTNLGADTYISVEEISAASSCSASLFLGQQLSTQPQSLADQNVTYSTASSTGAGAGNRYEEWVYAIAGTNPCIAIRYFIHYAVLENYTPGAVQAFDHAGLLLQFDAIRRTLTLI